MLNFIGNWLIEAYTCYNAQATETRILEAGVIFAVHP
jgi:hypothetical protein